MVDEQIFRQWKLKVNQIQYHSVHLQRSGKSLIVNCYVNEIHANNKNHDHQI